MKTNNPPRPNVYNFQIRLLSVGILVGVCFLVILGRVFYLQIWHADYYEELAKKQQQRTIEIESKRNPIYDRRGRLLATSIKVDSIHAFPPAIQFPEKTAQQLASLLKIDKEKLLKKLKAPRSFVWVKRQVNPAVSAKIKAFKINGIDFIQEYKRYYPFGNFAGPLLGFTGIDSQGLEGLEYEYQNFLKGEKKKYIVEQDGTHRIIPSVAYQNMKAPQPYSLHLTIDSSIQYFSEKALRKGLKRTQAQKGIAIVMESKTGAILALAHMPGFDPNRFQQFPRSHYLNYAVTSGYEPGSTLKLITIATALEENLIDAEQAFFCENGAFQIADQVIHDVKPYGWLTVQQIIQKSSNICSSKVGLSISKETFFDYLREFGFGSKLNIGLSAEALGKVPSSENWTSVDHASISFGHGILSSPMQLLTAINAMGTEGILIFPYIVEHIKNKEGVVIEEIKDESGKTIRQFGPRPQKKVISPKTAGLMRQFMISVTQEEGSGTLAAIPGITVAGKTGTTEVFDEQTGAYSKKDNIASFIGIVPAQDPILTILVVIESPQSSSYGGLVAAPIFREIAERSLVFLSTGFTKTN